MSELSLEHLLAEGRQDLAALKAAGDDPHAAIGALLNDVYRIGLALERDPSHCTSPELRQFVDDSASALYDQSTALLFHPSNIVRRFQETWYTDEWVQLCKVRSGLQYLIELYRDTQLIDFLRSLEVDYVDDFIRSQGHEGYLDDDKIPRSIPRSHWWWWYPDPPRPGASG